MQLLTERPKADFTSMLTVAAFRFRPSLRLVEPDAVDGRDCAVVNGAPQS
jgi:hypothetical protein